MASGWATVFPVPVLSFVHDPAYNKKWKDLSVWTVKVSANENTSIGEAASPSFDFFHPWLMIHQYTFDTESKKSFNLLLQRVKANVKLGDRSQILCSPAWDRVKEAIISSDCQANAAGGGGPNTKKLLWLFSHAGLRSEHHIIAQTDWCSHLIFLPFHSAPYLSVCRVLCKNHLHYFMNNILSSQWQI